VFDLLSNARGSKFLQMTDASAGKVVYFIPGQNFCATNHFSHFSSGINISIPLSGDVAPNIIITDACSQVTGKVDLQVFTVCNT
jgi:hypothetical protein